MRDLQIAGPIAAVAQHNDLVGIHLDARRHAGAGREDIEVAQQGRVARRIGLDLAKRQRDAESACGARKRHGTVGVGCDDCLASRSCGLGARRRDARAFDLNEMDVAGVLDVGLIHRGLDRSRQRSGRGPCGRRVRPQVMGSSRCRSPELPCPKGRLPQRRPGSARRNAG